MSGRTIIQFVSGLAAVFPAVLLYIILDGALGVSMAHAALVVCSLPAVLQLIANFPPIKGRPHSPIALTRASEYARAGSLLMMRAIASRGRFVSLACSDHTRSLRAKLRLCSEEL